MNNRFLTKSWSFHLPMFFGWWFLSRFLVGELFLSAARKRIAPGGSQGDIATREKSTVVSLSFPLSLYAWYEKPRVDERWYVAGIWNWAICTSRASEAMMKALAWVIGWRAYDTVPPLGEPAQQVDDPFEALRVSFSCLSIKYLVIW